MTSLTLEESCGIMRRAQSSKMFQTGARLMEKYAHLNLILLDQAMVSFINFMTGLLQARFMGMHEFGKYSLAWMIMLFIVSLQSAAILSPMMSIGPKQSTEEQPFYFGSVILQQVFFALLISVLLYMGVYGSRWVFPQWQITDLALPLAFVALFLQLQEFVRRYFFTNGRPLDAFINDVISYTGQLILLIIVFLWKTTTTEEVLYIIAGTSLIAVIAGVFRFKPVRFTMNHFKATVHRHLYFSGWLLASTFTQWVSSNYMLMVACTLLGPAAVGTVKASQNILGMTHILFNGLANLIPVRGSRIFVEDGLPGMERYLRKMFAWGGWATLLLALPSLLFPGILLQWVYGKNFGENQWILFLFVFVYLALFVNQILSFGLRILEDTRPIFLGYFISGIISVLLAYPIVQTFKLPGVVMGLIVLTVVNSVVLGIGYLKKRKEPNTPKEGRL